MFFPVDAPHFFIPGSGMTPLKIRIEYSLVLMYGIAAVALYRKACLEAGFNRADLFAAASITCLSELCATLYGSVSDTFNIACHVFKIISFLLIFRAVFVDSVRQPFRDLNGALLKERQYAAEQHSLVRTLDMLEEGVVELSPDGVVMHANTGWWRLADTRSTNGTLDELIHPQDRPAFLACLGHLQSGQKDEFHGRFRFVAGASHERWMDCRFLAERNDRSLIIGIRGVLRDITKTYLQERHIAHMAHHDALTGLPNRILLEDRISKAIQSAKRHNEIVAVCFVDLDHFKNINDAYGHKTGDGLLREVSSALVTCLEEGDTVARWGGDEFVVLFPCITDLDAAREAAGRLINVMGQSFESNGQCVNATFSVGVSLYPIDGDNVDTLLTHADRAMFYAKSQGRNNFQFFSDMTERGFGKKELYIQARLAQALRDECITVWFQPLVSTRSVASGERYHLTGVEALARWKDDEFGWIPPGSFIPMAENLGLIGELGRLVRRKSLAQFREWMPGRPDLHLSLNISKRQLVAPDFCSSMVEDCVTFGVPTGRLVLEVTESIALMEVEGAADQLQRLADAGFTLSIDDFGTGYASLSQLHALPVGELKIDISFVRRAHTPDGLRILQAIVQLAKALSFRTVAEGVEDEATSALLDELNVDIQQGYYFGRPCAGEEFEEHALYLCGELRPCL
ncbi:bifunctional diguanylate cyclase/phosphodiesterase [Cupriavidus metallidurans]|uniref:bifunctional diguanylate cyclase/phosphodiesterase n=1 Tax=Cupriavidus metallidurans TaxID=119219 RepID=UPI0022771EDF|nr:EAL domain-containing protein [Cupriavidus metallidurans]